MKKEYIQNIKNLRIEKGISQKDMAEKLGFGHSNYNKIENGLIEITVSKLYEISEILEVSVNSILGNSELDNLKIEIKKKDEMIGVLTVLLTEFASGKSKEETSDIAKNIKEKVSKSQSQ